MKKSKERATPLIETYERIDILTEVKEEDPHLSLDEKLREEIVSGMRKRKLENVTLKLDPLHVTAIKKIATMKSMPYQTLIRHWLSEEIKQELGLEGRRAFSTKGSRHACAGPSSH